MYFLVVLAFDMTSIVYLLSIKDSKLVFNTTSSASGIVDSHKMIKQNGNGLIVFRWIFLIAMMGTRETQKLHSMSARLSNKIN